MKYIIEYSNFNESRGISDSCEKSLYKIWGLIENDILSGKENTIFIDINEDDFKVKDLKIYFTFFQYDENISNAVTNLKNAEIKNGFLENTEISFLIKYKTLDDAFLYYIKSIVLHELLHIFQYYNLKINNKFRSESFSIGSIIPQLRNNIKTKYINYILDIIYYSLSHEISAQLHQYYIYKIEGREYDRLKKIKEILENFKIKELDISEESELNFIKKHVLNSIKFYSNNKKYNKDILKSLWNKNNKEFITDLSDLVKSRVDWIDKKIKLIDNKNIIDYSETFSYYGNLKDYKGLEFSLFIKNNFKYCPLIQFI